MHDLTMTIAGTASPTTVTFDVVNPATGEVFATAPACAVDQLDAAFQSSADAYRGSWRQDEDRRRSVMLAAADALDAAAGDIAPILTAEQGKPLVEATLEVHAAAIWFRYYAGLERTSEVIQDDATAEVTVVRRPLGVVAAITPWNVPLVLASWKVAPALRAGNTVVLKPSPFTPLSTLKLGEVLREVVPAGVLNVVSGPDPLGEQMVNHPVPRKVSFTGSVATGKRVAAAAAADLKRVTLELGGNDAAILLDDVDLDAIAPALFKAAFANNGQICSAVKRVYAPRSRYDEVVEALAEQGRAVCVGDGTDPATQLGPLNNAAQLHRVEELVDDAVARGAVAITGGTRRSGPGYFYEPTIVAGVGDGVRIVDEEQFGPALPVIPYDTEEEALERANGTSFGLSGSVWGDPERSAVVAGQMDCGTVWVNTHLALAPHQPFGGTKWSGVGVENGPWGLDGFTDLHVMHRAKSGREGA